MQFKAIWDRQDETTDRTKQWIAKETRSLPNSSQLLSIIDEMVCNYHTYFHIIFIHIFKCLICWY